MVRVRHVNVMSNRYCSPWFRTRCPQGVVEVRVIKEQMTPDNETRGGGD